MKNTLQKIADLIIKKAKKSNNNMFIVWFKIGMAFNSLCVKFGIYLK